MRKLGIVFVAIALAACATYSDTTSSRQLSADIHRVSMKGNAFNDPSDAQEFALLKAAEVTVDSGANYFVIMDINDTTTTGQFVQPGSSTSNTYGSATGYGYGNSAYVTGQSTTQTTYTPAQTMTFVKPGVDFMIKTFTEKPSEGHYDANEIVKYLGPDLNPERWGKKPD